VTTYTCQDCQRAVPSGDALLRSIAFEQVAYCRECWEHEHRGVVPAPRRSPEDAWLPAGVARLDTRGAARP
jgi:hypothetical protein